jgi:RpiB/LacA/LacB family sugar-phosphate isomerase
LPIKDAALASTSSTTFEVPSSGSETITLNFAIKVADAVSRSDAERGILFCWTGIGMCISANKVKGIRAALCLNEEMAMLTRQHNDSNVLSLSAKFIPEEELLKIVRVWLETPFEGGRHSGEITGSECVMWMADYLLDQLRKGSGYHSSARQ